MCRVSTSLRKRVALQPGQRIHNPSGTPRLGRPGTMLVLLLGFMLGLRRTRSTATPILYHTGPEKRRQALFTTGQARRAVPLTLPSPPDGLRFLATSSRVVSRIYCPCVKSFPQQAPREDGPCPLLCKRRGQGEGLLNWFLNGLPKRAYAPVPGEALTHHGNRR